MSKFKIYEDSKNYTATVVKLTNIFSLPGLDNVGGTVVFGNTCIVPKHYSLDDLYVFFPSECKLSQLYLSYNNLYRENTFNTDISQKGYFEENGRVKAIKFKGNKSTGVVMPLSSLDGFITSSTALFTPGEEFNEIDGQEICRKYIVKKNIQGPGSMKSGRILDSLIDSKFFPENPDTSQLLKNLHKLKLEDRIVITKKMHGTSERVAYTLVKRKLRWLERLVRKLGVKVVEEEYKLVVGSRRVVKSIDFTSLKYKKHFYSEDLWTRVAEEFFSVGLYKGEMIYFEVVGKDYNGADIQPGYNYGFTKPEVYIYKITNINAEGVEIDLTWEQMKERCIQLSLYYVVEEFVGTIEEFLSNVKFMDYSKEYCCDALSLFGCILQDAFLDKPSTFDPKVIEEGICVRVEKYPNPEIYKLKSPLFLIHESKQNDKEIVDIESNA